MKTNKLIAAGAMALSMAMTPVASLINAMPIAAEGTINVPVAGDKETQRTYKYYQIFTGTYATDKDGTKSLVELKWGSDGRGEYNTAVSKADVDALLNLVSESADEKTVANTVRSYLKTGATGTEISGSTVKVADGYYLIEETTDLAGKPEAKNLDVVQIVGGEYTIANKNGAPTFEKKTKDQNDSSADSLTGWQDSGDWDFGDNVPFQLKATLGDRYNDYSHYNLVFNDTYDSNAFDAPQNVVVKVGDKELSLENSEYAVAETSGTLTVTIFDLKESAPEATTGTVVTVEYTATLKNTATLGAATNTENRNQAYIQFTNDPKWNGEGESPKGETPKDQVRVFTYKLDVNKKAEDGKTVLKGATFKLSKKNSDGTYVEVATITGTDKDVFTFSGLDDGDYKLEETKAPEGYNAITPIEFTISATHDTQSDDPVLEELDFGELKATITDDKNGTVDITNTKNANLPETGGMGTTLIYGAGALMVAGAAVVYVTNKRTRKD